MAINFPSTTGQATDGSFTHVVGYVTYKWNGVSWNASVSGQGGGGITDINEIGNVDTTGLATGEFFAYDGTNWTPNDGIVYNASVSGYPGSQTNYLVLKDDTGLGLGTGHASGHPDVFFDWNVSGTTGSLTIKPNTSTIASYDVYLKGSGASGGISILNGGAVELHYGSNGKRLETSAQGVNVTGRIAAESLSLDVGGSITAAGTSIDFQNSTISFSGASIGGLQSTINAGVDVHLNTSGASSGEILSWNGTDYAWVADQTGGGSSTSSVLVSPETFDITVPSATNTTYSKYYTLSGNDRYGQVGGNDVPVKMYTGDTVTFDTSALSGSHPLYIRVSDGGASVSNPAATGEGTASISWTPAATGTYYYQCGDHSEMSGVIYVEDPINAEPTIDVTNSNIGGEWSYGDTGDDPLNWGDGSSIVGHNIARNNLPQYMPAYSDTAGNLPPIANPPDHPDPVSLAFDARYDTWLNVASSIDNGVIELTFTNPLNVDYFNELTIGYDGNVQPGYNGGNYVTTTTLTNDIQEIVVKPYTSGTGLQLENLVFKTVTASGATGRLYYVIASFGGSNGMMVYKSSKVGIGGAGKTLYKHDASVNLQLGAEHLNSIIAVNTLIPRSLVLPIHYMCREGDTITILDVGTGKLNRNDDGTFPNAFSPGYPSYDYNPGNATNCPIVIYPSLEQGIQQTGPAPWTGDQNGSSVYWLPTTNTTGKYWGEDMHGMPFVVNKNGQSIKLVFCGAFYGWRILS